MAFELEGVVAERSFFGMPYYLIVAKAVSKLLVVVMVLGGIGTPRQEADLGCLLA